MNTKQILLITSDKDISGIVKVSALTLTKLNCQVSIENVYDYETALESSKAVNLDLIILDNENAGFNTIELISEMRKDSNSKHKKIILIYEDSVSKDEIFKAGCDSIMSKAEFKRVVNNVLVF